MTKITSQKNWVGDRELGRFTVLRIPDAKPADVLQWAVTDETGTVLFRDKTMSACLKWAKEMVDEELISRSR